MGDPATYVLIISIVINGGGLASSVNGLDACKALGKRLEQALMKQRVRSTYVCEANEKDLPVVKSVPPPPPPKPTKKCKNPWRKYRIVNHQKRWYIKCN